MMTEFLGRVDIKNMSGSEARIKLEGDERNITIYSTDGKHSIILDGISSGNMTLYDGNQNRGFALLAKMSGEETAGLWIGANVIDGTGLPKAGYLCIRDKTGNDSIVLDGRNNSMALGGVAGSNSIAFDANSGTTVSNRIVVKDKTGGKDSMILDGSNNSMALRDVAGSNSIIFDARSGTTVSDRIVVKDKTRTKDSMVLNGASGNVDIYNENGKRGLALRSKVDDKTAGLWIGASISDPGPLAGYVVIRDSDGKDSIELDGRSGDIILKNADCAEDFDIAESAEIEPGTVMVIDQDGKLRQSNMPYDKRVAGVVSGAQNYKPGLVLDKRKSASVRKSVSLMGKVYCKADPQYGSIEVGDLLTTSNTPGHAMKATDPMKAFGSVIGKALGALNREMGLIPILVTLQ